MTKNSFDSQLSSIESLSSDDITSTYKKKDTNDKVKRSTTHTRKNSQLNVKANNMSKDNSKNNSRRNSQAEKQED